MLQKSRLYELCFILTYFDDDTLCSLSFYITPSTCWYPDWWACRRRCPVRRWLVCHSEEPGICENMNHILRSSSQKNTCFIPNKYENKNLMGAWQNQETFAPKMATRFPCLGHPLLAISTLHAHSVDAVALLGFVAHLPSLAELNSGFPEKKSAGKNVPKLKLVDFKWTTF